MKRMTHVLGMSFLIAGMSFINNSLLSSPVCAQDIACQHDLNFEIELNMPIYQWMPPDKPPESAKGIILAMHGLVMHGKTFTELGKTLAKNGFLVFATDMRGYGRLTKDHPHEFCTASDCKHKINYKKSENDLLKLTEKLKSEYSQLPIYIIGESLGADMAIRIASTRPELADGLILSAPAIRAHSFIDKTTVKNLPVVMTNFHQQLDMMPYVKRYASNDPKIVQEMTEDPLLRKRLSTWELACSRKSINDTLSYVPNISPNKPVLVLQAKDDRCVRADAVVLLMSKLKTQDQQVRWFEERGHILIETAHIKTDTLETILHWLNEHNLSKQEAFIKVQPTTAFSNKSLDNEIETE